MKIYIEERGWGMGQTDFMLYTVNKLCKEGHGIQFGGTGEPYTFAWCHPSEENMLPDDLKRKFMYSFKHGSNELYIKDELLKGGADFWEVLRDERNYDYKWVSPEDVETQKKIEALEIKSKDDVIRSKDLLFNNPISHGVVCKVLAAFGVPQTEVHNGEIGIAAMYDFAKFSAIKETLCNGHVFSEGQADD